MRQNSYIFVYFIFIHKHSVTLHLEVKMDQNMWFDTGTYTWQQWHIWKQMYLEYFQSCNIWFLTTITIKTAQFIQLYIFAALRLTASGFIF